MLLLLVNYGSGYEVEQLSRMFFRDLTVKKAERRRGRLPGDFIYVRKYGKGKIFVCLSRGGKRTSSVLRPGPGQNEDMRLCLAVYDICSKALGKGLPWGVLTGVRPVRLMRNLYKKSENIQSVINTFRDGYLVSDEKIRLCLDVFNTQKPIIDGCAPEDYSLYISIPFCPSRCSYCSFVSVSVGSMGHLMEGYVDSLCREIERTAALASRAGMRLRTVYIGGGTPTAISAKQLARVMGTVAANFDLGGVSEYTVEAGRPDCTNFEKLKLIKDFGAGRISVNPQTFSDRVLRNIGRAHTTADFLRCMETARKVGFDSINTDLIAGLPGDTVESFENSLRGCISLGAENITVHTLTLKRASSLVIENRPEDYGDVDAMLGKRSLLYDSGYRPYYMYRQKSTLNNLENVGFSQVGHESLYNIYIMEEVQTIISCGAGGVSKVVGDGGKRIKRVYNYKYPAEYINNFENILARKEEVFELCRQHGYRKGL